MVETERVKAGEQNGWCEALYHAKASELVLYGRALGLSHSEAEDVLQDTFLALMRRGEAPARPEHYAVRAFRNRALNYRRSLWRRCAREWESGYWFEPTGHEGPAERQAMRCLADLPREQREVIVLKIWHDYTFEEIGRLLEISPNTAAGRYRYGLQKLRRYVKGTESEYERDERDERDERLGSAIALVGAAPPLGEA
jgi:RNA polymerase sigma-70 factor (ECF subfamily)